MTRSSSLSKSAEFLHTGTDAKPMNHMALARELVGVIVLMKKFLLPLRNL
jgi:hypothetical protein